MESSLAVQYQDLVGEVAFNLGFGRGPAFGEAAFLPVQQTTLDAVVKSGLRQFYFPPPLQGTGSAYDWSFLKPTASFDFPQGATTILLPDDFGGFEGQLTLLTNTTTAQPWRIQWENEGRIRQRYAITPSMQGAPMYAAEQPIKGTTGTAGQRWQLILFPMADQDYTLQAQYYVNPDYLSGAFPYAYGGAQHAETMLESCLAIAEQRLDDMSNGPHTMKFQERLAASIGMDRKNKPQRLGYNSDQSDYRGNYRNGDQHWWAAPGTYNGNSMD